MANSQVVPVYLVVDVSGSAAFSGLARLCNQAMPGVVDELVPRVGAPVELTILAFTQETDVILSRTRTDEIIMIPAFVPGGIGSVSSALRCLHRTIDADRGEAAADRTHDRAPARVALISDGFPADDGREMATSFAALGDADIAQITWVLVGHLVRADFAAIGARLIHVPALTDEPDALIEAILSSVGA